MKGTNMFEFLLILSIVCLIVNPTRILKSTIEDNKNRTHATN